MLSRSAEGLYWMGRYLERTGFICRLLQLQAEALVDRPARDIHAGWRRLYASIGREPPGGDLGDAESDDFTLADSYTLAGDLTFERSNPDSVWNCFAQSRENARQMRHCVSAEVWQRLNLAYLRIRDMDEPDIWAESPEKFYAGMTAEVAAIEGAASTTIYRDEGWRFLALGRALERAQSSCALLLAQTEIDEEAGTADADTDWGCLLKALRALEPYQLRYGVAVEPGAALDLIVTDPLLPGSLARLFDALEGETEALAAGPAADAGGAARRAAGRLSALVKHHWPDSGDRLALLRAASDQSLELHGLLASAYFAYAA